MKELHNLIVSSNTLNLNEAQKRTFGISMGEIIKKFYSNPENKKRFQREEEILKKEVKRLEAKRDSGRKKEKS